MVGDASNRFRDTFDISHHSAEIGVQPFPPSICNERRAIFGAEDDVVIQREVSGWHGFRFPRPCRGASRSIRNPVADATG